MSYLDTRIKDIYLGVDQSTPNIQHFGILGMKWGIRRYQNPDGTLTEEGKKRYKGMTIDDVENRHKANKEKQSKKFRDNVTTYAIGSLMSSTRSNSKFLRELGLGLKVASLIDMPMSAISATKESFDYRRDKKILENLQKKNSKKKIQLL